MDCSNTESCGLNLGRTAVHEELDPVDETGIAGGEEEGDGRDLLRASHFAAWDLRLEELLGIWSEGIEDRRVDGAGAEDVHPNSPLLEFHQPGASERADCGLACAVDAERREALDAHNRAVQKNGAVVVEERERLLHGEERPAHVEVEGLVEVLLGDLIEFGEFAATGTGEEDVDLAFFAFDCLVETVEIGQVGGIALNTGNVFADKFHGLIELVLAASCDEDVGSFFDEQFGCGERHAGRGCRNDCDFAFELAHILISFLG